MSDDDAARPARSGPALDAAVVAVVIAVLGITVPGSGAGEAFVLGGTLAVVVVTWFTAGRHALDGGRTWPAVAAVLIGAGLVGTLVDPAFATFQIIAFPIAWLITPGFRSAVVLNALIALAIGVGYAISASVPLALATEGLSLAFSLAMGMWITRIQTRSEERQRLIDRLTATQQQLSALSREAGAVAERERLARELHDTLTQSLTGIVMLAERARSRHPADQALSVLEESARQAMTEARGLVAASAGVPLEGGLEAALQTLADRFQREAGLAVQVSVTVEVPRGSEVVLLRCAQEGLSNVRKHADARSVAVDVRPEGSEAVLTVVDDGRGPGHGRGFGLAGMRDRLALVGGEARLEAAPGAGSRLTVRVPLIARVPA